MDLLIKAVDTKRMIEECIACPSDNKEVVSEYVVNMRKERRFPW